MDWAEIRIVVFKNEAFMPEIILKIRPEVLDRIESSFQSSVKKCPPERNLTPYWVKHSSLISCKRLARNSILVSGESGFNFPRARYGGLDYVNTLEKALFMKDTLRRWEKKGHRLSLPPHLGYSFLGRKLSYDFLRAIYHADSILSPIPTLPPAPRILEIGGGTGVLAHVFKMMVPQCQYVLVDLPEVLHLAALFLSSVSENKTFAFYGAYEHIEDSTADFVFLPNFEIASVPDGYCDLVINTASMQEMNYRTIAMYFHHIRRILRGPRLFYQSNRQSKTMGSENIEVDKYPFTPSDNHLFKKENKFMSRAWALKKLKHIPLIVRGTRRGTLVHIHSLTVMT